jgi:hypothetical protein
MQDDWTILLIISHAKKSKCYYPILIPLLDYYSQPSNRIRT